MDEEEFKQKCPNLYKALNEEILDNYEIYGIKFKSHSILYYYKMLDRENNCREYFNLLGDLKLIIIN